MVLLRFLALTAAINCKYLAVSGGWPPPPPPPQAPIEIAAIIVIVPKNPFMAGSVWFVSSAHLLFFNSRLGSANCLASGQVVHTWYDSQGHAPGSQIDAQNELLDCRHEQLAYSIDVLRGTRIHLVQSPELIAILVEYFDAD